MPSSCNEGGGGTLGDSESKLKWRLLIGIDDFRDGESPSMGPKKYGELIHDDFAKEVVLSFTLDFDDYDCAVVAGPELKGEFHQPPRDGLRSGALLVKEV